MRYLGPLCAAAVVAGLILAGCATRHPVATEPADPIALAVMPRAGLAPRDVRVTVRVDKDAANRHVCLAFVQDGLDKLRSCHTVDGAEAPRFWQHLFEQVPAGSYDVQLRVTRADGSMRRVAISVCYAGQLHESCGPNEDAP